MKLFVIASLIAISAAGRLEHLERSYLPPTQGSFGSSSFGPSSGAHGSHSPNSGSHGTFGASAGGHDSFGAHSGSHGSFSANTGSFGAPNGFGSSAGRPSETTYNAGSSILGATSNQYLPPDQGSASSIGSPQFSGSLQGFSNQRYQPQQYTAPQSSNSFSQSQYTIPSTQYGTPQGSSFGAQQGSPSFGSQTSSSGSRYQSQSNQFGAASRQYLAPKATPSFNDVPQQSFDEQTGYHY